MKILVINCGSSSLKYQLIDMDGEKVLCKGLCERIGMESSMITHEANGTKATTPAIFPTHTEAFAEVVKKMTTGAGKCINDVSEIDAIGHRVVHGGEKFKSSCLITDEVINTLRELSPLAPLHNPAGILGIEAARKVFGNIPMVAVFDTAFHSTMPPKAYMYAIPYEYYEKYGVRRYGFHGTSHKYVAHKAAEYLEEPIERLKLITCHLGNGSSIAAVDQGKVVDTSMGMTPLAGLMMGTRCGDLDPSVVNYLKYTLNITGHELDEILNKKSGLLGISGVSSDKRDVEEAAEAGNKRAQLASDMLNYQIKKTIGSYIAAMGGVDAIVFTGGIGEHDAVARAKICHHMDWLGIRIDTDKNKHIQGDVCEITAWGAKVRTLVIATDEALTHARKSGLLPWLRPDGKSQVSVEYGPDGMPARIDTVVVSTQHADTIAIDDLRKAVIETVIEPNLPSRLLDENTKYYVNPTGRFVIGGPAGDSGLTGRKIIVDTYGGYAAHGGGAFSGKDPTKVDRSGAYMARYIAKNLVAAGLADACQLQLAYAIGVAHPVSVLVETYGTGKIADDKLAQLVRECFDLRPAAIIKTLDLRRPIYRQTAGYGHFGRAELDLPWEKTDMVQTLLAKA